jgi:exonuclease VII small subunit
MNDLRLASTIKLYNPPLVEKRRCNPRLKGNEQTLSKMIKSLKSAWNNDLL